MLPPTVAWLQPPTAMWALAWSSQKRNFLVEPVCKKEWQFNYCSCWGHVGVELQICSEYFFCAMLHYAIAEAAASCPTHSSACAATFQTSVSKNEAVASSAKLLRRCLRRSWRASSTRGTSLHAGIGLPRIESRMGADSSDTTLD